MEGRELRNRMRDFKFEEKLVAMMRREYLHARRVFQDRRDYAVTRTGGIGIKEIRGFSVPTIVAIFGKNNI